MILLSTLFLLQFINGGLGSYRTTVATSRTAIGNLCPNGCSGRGVCLNNATSICKCFPGFTTPDCSQRLCPAARAWVDFPTANNTAHANFTECSNMGLCDRSTGICSCRKGFGGAACDMMLCPIGTTTSDTIAYAYRSISTTTQPCSGRGRCLSLREITQYQDYSTYLGYTSYTGWDEDMIHGCLCDTGWEGVACEKRSCPKGDDPLTAGVNEVQLIDCQCSRCKGGIYISYNGQTTPFIPYDADDIMIQYYMSKLSSITEIAVEFRQGTQLCSYAGSVTAITFKIPQGPQNSITIARSNGLRGLLISVRSKGLSSVINPNLSPSVIGTKEYAECSNHGVCNYNTGVCNCYGGYKSSDGLGNSGTIGDCGYRFRNYWNYTVFEYDRVYNASTNVNTTVLNMTHVYTNCPFDNNAICSGNGTCDSSTGLCSCYSGYGGPACANRTCETAYTWFGNALASHTATSTCGGVGECNGDTGKCINCGGNWGVFTGDRCEHLSCYSDGYGRSCSDNGACMSMRHMAYYAYNDKKERSMLSYDTPWDADRILGCVCYRAISVDNQYYTDYKHIIDVHSFNASTLNDTAAYTDTDLIKFYRGPYAYAATDFIGYNCQQALCPKGDNPRTVNTNFSNEIQMLQCRADNGSFTLTFRENTTLPISINDTAAQLEYRLEQLYTIGDVSVTITGGLLKNKSICNAYDNITVYIEFLTEFGDLPLLKADTSLIRNYGAISGFGVHYELVNITEYRRGDKEDIECSGMGACDQSSGVCSCFKGYSSSNGTTSGAGQMGECSFYNIFYTEGSQ